MGQPAARMGDPTVHGGALTTGAATVLIGGQPAATMGALHVCPLCSPGPHVGGPVLAGAPTVLIEKQPAARMGDLCACAAPAPDAIAAGLPTVLIGSAGAGAGGGAMAAAASAHDATVHPGTPGTGTTARPLSPWVGVGYVDAAGRPVAAWHYRAEGGPSSRSGQVGTGGQVWLDALAEDGPVEVGLVGVYACRWERDEARVGEPVGMSARCVGVEDGALALFEVWRESVDGAGASSRAKVFEVMGEVAGGRVEAAAPFGWDDAENEGVGEGAAVYVCETSVGGVHRSRGGDLRVRDDLALRVVNENGDPVSDFEHEIQVTGGEVHELKTNGGGGSGIEDVQPGRYRIELASARDAGSGPSADGTAALVADEDRFDITLATPTSVLRVPRLSGHAHANPDPTVRFQLWSDSKDFSSVDRITFEVHAEETLLWSESHTADYVQSGRHEWVWDGVDHSGVYDTSRLRRGVRLTISAVLGSRTVTKSVELRGVPLFFGEGVLTAFDWLDTRVDTSSRAADVTLYVECHNAGYIDLVSDRGAFVPNPFSEDLPAMKFQRLKRLVISGIETYWSRTGTRSAHGYQVRVRAGRGSSARRPSHDVDVYVNRDRDPARSANLPGATPFLIYNRTFWATRGGAAGADLAFKMTAAHEFGHSIVAATQGRHESYSHHGTTGVVSQSANDSATAYPTTGEIDLMKYYDDLTPPPLSSIYSRTVASERDVTKLVEGLAIRMVSRMR